MEQGTNSNNKLSNSEITLQLGTFIIATMYPVGKTNDFYMLSF